MLPLVAFVSGKNAPSKAREAGIIFSYSLRMASRGARVEGKHHINKVMVIFGIRAHPMDRRPRVFDQAPGVEQGLRDEHGTGISVFERKKTISPINSFFGNTSTRVEYKTPSTTSLEKLFIPSTNPQTPFHHRRSTFAQHSVNVCMF